MENPTAMKTAGQLLGECGQRLAPFDRARVGKVGCGVSLAAIAAAAAALTLGLWPADGWAAGFRFVVLVALASVILVFLLYAAAETLVERAVLRRIDAYARESGNDLETLANAAQMRAAAIPGGRRLAALLAERSGQSRR